MPELPDVELFRRYIDDTWNGRAIERVVVNDPKMLRHISAETLRQRLKGSRVRGARRHGKHLLIQLSPAGWLTMHFGMNGSLKHLGKGAVEPPYDRVRLDFSDGHRLAYINPRRLGGVEFVEDADTFIAAEKLGPDVLDPHFDLATFERALSGRDRDIKAVLMDQAAMAGIGNIYSDEVLFQAGIHPSARADRLGSKSRHELFRQIKRVLETAVERGAGAEISQEALPRSFLLPRRKKGGLCPRCGGKIGTIKFSGRTAYYCPHCQKKAG
jgi:formamidopyrimidine-DNA glycosylase